MPDLTGMDVSAARAALKEKSLSCRTQGDGETVSGQVPAAGAVIPGGSEVVLYLGTEAEQQIVTVPDVTGKDAESANRLLTEAGLYMKIIGATGSEGTILATRQLPEAGENVKQGTVVEVEFSDLGARD